MALTPEQFETAHQFKTYGDYVRWAKLNEDADYPFMVVGRIFGLPAKWNEKKTRVWEYTAARHITAWVFVRYMDYPLEAIAILLNFDRTSVYYAVKRVNAAIEGYDPRLSSYAEKVKRLYDTKVSKKVEEQK